MPKKAMKTKPKKATNVDKKSVINPLKSGGHLDKQLFKSTKKTKKI